MRRTTGTATVHRLGRWLPVTAAVVGLVAWSGQRVLHRANADALLPALMSTEELTWFYWGQDRLANVVPLLAWPVRDIRWNIAVQLGLIGAGWFGLIAAVAANHLAGTGRGVRPVVVAAVTAVAGVGSMWLLSPRALQIFVFEQQYAFALLLFAAGLLSLTRPARRSQVVGALVVLAATMINPSLVLHAPLALVMPGVAVRSRAAALAIGVSVAAFVATNLTAAVLVADAGRGDGYATFSLRRSWANLEAVVGDFGRMISGWWVPPVVGLAAVVLIVRRTWLPARLVRLYVGAPAFAVAWTALFSGSRWIENNGLHARYFFPVFAAGVVLFTAAFTELLEPVVSRVGQVIGPARSVPEWAWPAAVLASVACAVVGVWSLRIVEIDTLVAARPAVHSVRQHDVDIVAGDYWQVWPTVITARADGLDVLGFSSRSDPLLDELSERIATALRRDGSVNVLCLDLDEVACGASLAGWGLTPRATLAVDPLVISLGPDG